MAKKKAIKRKLRKTLLVVGEGHTEVAFLKYLKTLFCQNKKGVSVKVENASGKGPEHVLDKAIRLKKNADYDNTLAFLDTDIIWSDQLKQDADRNNIVLIGNSPCIEGLFLELLGHKVPNSSKECKSSLNKVIPYNLLDKNQYPKWCSLEMITALSKKDKELKKLISYYKGEEIT